jgi:F-type H+-transporting ATPase subunit epsilon
MAGKIAFELVSPERLLESSEADMVVVPGAEGDFGVLPGHVPLISTLRPGVIEIYDGATVRQRIMVTGGFAEVSNDRLTVLVEEAMPLADISVAQLEGKLRQAQEAVAEATDPAARESAEKQVLMAQNLRRAYDFYATR